MDLHSSMKNPAFASTIQCKYINVMIQAAGIPRLHLQSEQSIMRMSAKVLVDRDMAKLDGPVLAKLQTVSSYLVSAFDGIVSAFLVGQLFISSRMHMYTYPQFL